MEGLGSVEFVLYCTGRAAHPRCDLGTIIDGRSDERVSPKDVHTLLSQVDPYASLENSEQVACVMNRSRTGLTYRGLRVFWSEADRRLEIPQQSLTVAEGKRGRTFLFACPRGIRRPDGNAALCGRRWRRSETGLERLVDLMRAQGEFSMDLSGGSSTDLSL